MPAEPTSESESSWPLAQKRLAFVGRLASMSRRDAASLVRQHGAVVEQRPSTTTQLIVLGEEDFALPELGGMDDAFETPVQDAIEAGRAEVITETQLWQRLGLVGDSHETQAVYTPAMLAELLGVPVAVIRRWHRRGLIRPVREVRRLPYFDFHEVATARRLAKLLATGMSPKTLEKKLERLGRHVPDIERPLAQLSVIIEGRQILLRQGDGLIEPGGQYHFDFEAASEPTSSPAAPQDAREILHLLDDRTDENPAPSPETLVEMAAELEEAGELTLAAEIYRAAMAAGQPQADLCFQLAEMLYRLDDLAGARERYYMAVELDEDFVEARANLGCVLAELGQHDLAIAAFHGALAFHPDYADVHYHLAQTLDRQGLADEARTHWEAFLALAPNSPWAEEAQQRLSLY